MVVNLVFYSYVHDAEFENGVIFDGSEPVLDLCDVWGQFENGVIFDGSEPTRKVMQSWPVFENGVIFDGTDRDYILGSFF